MILKVFMENNFNSPSEIKSLLSKSGIAKSKLSIINLVLLGIMSGLFIGLGAHFATTAVTGTVDTLGFGLAKVLGGFVFSVGLMMVVITGSELFTGNSLMVISLLDKKITLNALLKNWVIVYIANLIGSVLLAIMVYYTGLNGSSSDLSGVGTTALNIANAKIGLTIVQAFLRGVLANFLVCLAVYFVSASKDIVSKILSCIFPIMAFVAMGFEHSIANMYFLPAGMLLSGGTISLASAALNIFAVTLGNIIGGALLVGVVYWYVNKE